MFKQCMPLCCLAVAIASLGFSIYNFSTREGRIDVAVEKQVAEAKQELLISYTNDQVIEEQLTHSIQEREKRFVHFHLPKFQKMFASSGMEGLENYNEENVTTIKQLFVPLFKMIFYLSS